VIEQGADLKRWEETGTEAVEARKGMLEVLRSSLLRPAVRQEAAPRRRLKKPKKLPYEEGTWFAVPLRDGGVRSRNRGTYSRPRRYAWILLWPATERRSESVRSRDF